MFNIDENGTITLVQGDSGSIKVVGIPTDKNYNVSFAVQDGNRKPIGSQITVGANKQDNATIVLSGNYTDGWTVPKNEEYATLSYGIKLWTTDGLYEDTSEIGTGYKGTINVYPKIVEGYND